MSDEKIIEEIKNNNKCTDCILLSYFFKKNIELQNQNSKIEKLQSEIEELRLQNQVHATQYQIQ